MGRATYDTRDKKWAESSILGEQNSPDSWPYTPTFESLHRKFNSERLQPWSAAEFWRLVLAVRKKGVSRHQRATKVPSPGLTVAQLSRIRTLLPRTRGAIDRLPYTEDYNRIFSEFNRLATVPVSESDLWRAILKIAKSRVGKTARPFVDHAIDALKRCIDSFNSISGFGRSDGVLIGLHHALELLMKAIHLQHGRSIADPDRDRNISFGRCVDWGLTLRDSRFLDAADAQFLKMLDVIRGQAYHAVVEVDEAELYLHTVTGVRLFDRLLDDIFGMSLAERCERRVLPISTIPLGDILVLLDRKRTQISDLLKAGEKARAVSAAKSMLAFERAAEGLGEVNVSEKDAKSVLDRLATGEDVVNCFPHVSAISLANDGDGARIQLSVRGRTGFPVLATPEDGTTHVVAVKTIDPATQFPLSHRQLADKCKLSTNSLTGVIKELSLRSRSDCCYMHGRVGSKSKSPGYSAKAIDVIKKFLTSFRGDPLELWRKHCRRQPIAS